MRQFLSVTIAHLSDCPTASTLTIAVLGIFSGSVAYFTNAVLMRLGTSGVAYAVIDAGVIGIVASVIGALALVGVRERRVRDIEHLRAVAELNHHVRNALQVIVDSSYVCRNEQTDAVLDSVRRIDRTLRVLFPPLESTLTGDMKRSPDKTAKIHVHVKAA
jgi:hypothetical protein